MVKKVIGTFYKKELKKTNQTEFRIEKVIMKNVINFMLNERIIITYLITGETNKIVLY